jgi:hypoxanthine phosphoribosyltransferase
MNRFLIPQSEVELAIDKLCLQIKQSGHKYAYIVGIENGGLHFSKPIAEALKLPHFSVGISYYAEGAETPSLFPILTNKGFTYSENGLLVDDLIDRGKTITTFKAYFGPIDTAVMFWGAGNKPTYYWKKKPHGWIVFPWEI